MPSKPFRQIERAVGSVGSDDLRRPWWRAVAAPVRASTSRDERPGGTRYDPLLPEPTETASGSLDVPEPPRDVVVPTSSSLASPSSVAHGCCTPPPSSRPVQAEVASRHASRVRGRITGALAASVAKPSRTRLPAQRRRC